MKEPKTPLAQSVIAFSPTPLSISRRPSLQNGACSSSSSLYEMVEDNTGNSSVVHTESSGSDSDTDVDEISTRHSNELFRASLGLQMSKRDGKEEIKSELSTPLLKRLKGLKPHIRAFRRITELQHEQRPLENEINHEKLVLLDLEDEEHYLTSQLMKQNNKTIEQNNSSYKKFEIVKKANQSWKLPKGPTEPSDQGRKRPLELEMGTELKRRAVSKSPNRTIMKRGNVKFVSRASEELQNMSLG